MFMNVDPCLTSASLLMEVPKCLRNSLSSGGLFGFVRGRSSGSSMSVQFDWRAIVGTFACMGRSWSYDHARHLNSGVCVSGGGRIF